MKIPAHLLIVDDEEALREVLEIFLSESVQQISTASNGVEALEKIRKNKYHAVLSDINMPKMTGLELLRQVRQEGHHTPFIVLTAYGDKEKAVEALKHGAFDFMDKPWTEEQLSDVVGRALELGLSLEQWADHADQTAELLAIHHESNQTSIEHLQKLLGLMKHQNHALRKKIGDNETK